MKLSELKNHLTNLEKIGFQLPNGELVPAHFHVTEVGKITKNFIDCGGKVRNEEVVNLQLWSANDYNHRLHPEKLIHILELSENKLGIQDNEIEVEYQGETIGKFGLDFNGKNFLLTTKKTNCLALDSCGIETEQKFDLSDLTLNNNACAPNSGCC